MSSSKVSSTILLLITMALVFQTSLGANKFLSSSCSNDPLNNFTSNTPFDSNLKRLITFLTNQTPHNGFSQFSFGQYPNQQVYGLSLCRGDISPSDCQTCVSEATTEILQNGCSYKKSAIIWYDQCMFKYSDQDFFGHIDDRTLYFLRVQNESDIHTDAFNYKAKELLSRLAEEARVSPKMYAAGEVKMVEEGKNVTVYGLTQCTRDLSSDDCKTCLDYAIDDISDCCAGRDNASVLRGSCNIRYEIYPFFKY